MEQIYNYFTHSTTNKALINTKELIKINTILNTINSDLSLEHKLDVPTLVTIGSQSSGKSTLLNRLLNLNVIPTGSTMETRTPINIELINTKENSHNNYYIEFGEYSNGKREFIHEKIKL